MYQKLILETDMSCLRTKSALSYFGSDGLVARELAELLNDCNHVTIPFVGGASIIPHLHAKAIVANDLHDLAINFYRVMSGPKKQNLIDRCKTTLSHPAELRDAITDSTSDDEISRAWAFWALCWICRKGKGGTKKQGGLPSVRRTANGGTNASRIRTAAEDLGEWACQFERCEWESVCFRVLLPKVADQEGCGIYCDPPWIDAGNSYLHPFGEMDHHDLANLLHRFQKTKVLVRYGDHPIIRDLYSDWTIIEAASRTQSNAIKNEIWVVSHLG